MKPLAPAVAAALLLAACGGGGSDVTKPGRHQLRKIEGSILGAPAGVSGKPVCIEERINGGARPNPRYEVTVDLKNLKGKPQPVFYSVFLTAAKRSYLGYVSTQTAKKVPGRTSYVLPPDTFGDLDTARVQPADRIGVLQIPENLTRCELRISEPTPIERKAGGRGLVSVGNDPVVVGPDGAERPMSEE